MTKAFRLGIIYNSVFQKYFFEILASPILHSSISHLIPTFKHPKISPVREVWIVPIVPEFSLIYQTIAGI